MVRCESALQPPASSFCASCQTLKTRGQESENNKKSKMDRIRRIPPWSDLPQELLVSISDCLNPDPIDILSFRCVCKSWCASTLPPSTSPPTLCPPLPLTTPTPSYPLLNRYAYSDGGFTFLSVTIVYALRPQIEEQNSSSNSRAWFLFVDQSNHGKVSIRKPFGFTNYSMPINFPRNLNLLEFHASEMGRFYNIISLPKSGKLKKSFVWSPVVRKVVLLSNCYGLSVVVKSDEGKVGLLRLGLRDNYENLGTNTKWEIIHDGKGYRFDDILDFKGRLLGIDRRGRVYEIEIGCTSPVKMKAICTPISGGGGRRKRLVESLGRLYIVVRCNVRNETDAMFKVYELNENAKKWVEANDLGDQTFLLGPEFSFSVPAKELHGSCGKNCILFRERSFLNYSGYDEDDNMFRKLDRDALHVGVWSFEDTAHLGVIGSHSGYSDVFWPPPSWIWPNDKSQRVGTLLNALDQLEMRFPDVNLEARSKTFSTQQLEGAVLFLKLTLRIKETKKRVMAIDKMLKQLEIISVSFQQWGQSVNQPNEVGTSTPATEERRVSLGLHEASLQEAFKELKADFDWRSVEMDLHSLILQCEENSSELENIFNSNDFSAYTDG